MEKQEVEVHTKSSNNTEECVDGMNPDSDSGSFDVLNDIEEKGGDTNEVTAAMSDTPVLGMTFDNDEDAYKYYNSYARRVGFSVRKLRLNKNRYGAIWKRQFCCSCEGFYTKKSTPKKKREEKRFGCEAMLEIKLSKAGKYVVTKFIVEHTHNLVPASSSQVLRSQRKIELPSQAGGINQLKRSSNDATYEADFDLCEEEALKSIRFRKLWHAFQPILAYGVRSDEAFNFVMFELSKLREKLESLINSEREHATTSCDLNFSNHENEDGDNLKLRDPKNQNSVVGRGKGRMNNALELKHSNKRVSSKGKD